MTSIAADKPSAERPLTIMELCLSDGQGGLEHYAAGLVSALRARGHRVITVAKKDSDFERRTGSPPDLTLRPHRYLRWLGAGRLSRLARETDIIHIHRSADLALAVLSKRHADGRPALVYTRHMLVNRDRKDSPAHRYMFRHVDRLLTITDEISSQAHRCLPIGEERIRMLPLGVSPTPGLEDCGAVRPAETTFVAGCFSRIEPAKGQHELIEAISRLRAMGIDAGCTFAGPVMDQNYEAGLRRQVAELRLGEHVRFIGTLEDARPAMACCDAVVMPSTGEALGLVLIEGMLMRVPVIGSASGGVLEFIRNGETGLTYPVGDVGELTRRLHSLATRPEWAAAIGEAGYRAASSQFDRERHLERLEAVFAAVLRERLAERTPL